MAELHYHAATQLENLHARYTGTIHPDVNKHEWITHQHRDTAASIIGYPQLLAYTALADGESQARTRFEITQVRRLFLSVNFAQNLLTPADITAHAATLWSPAGRKGRVNSICCLTRSSRVESLLISKKRHFCRTFKPNPPPSADPLPDTMAVKSITVTQVISPSVSPRRRGAGRGSRLF